MRLIPFDPKQTGELVPGVVMFSKNDPFARKKIVRPTKVVVRNGNTLKDEEGYPTGFVYAWPLYQKYSGEEPEMFTILKGMSAFKKNVSIFKVEP